MQDAAASQGDTGISRRTSAALALGCVFNPLNSSMIAVALVSLHEAFAVSLATTAWLVAGFYLAASVAQPVVGELADRFGARRAYCVGVTAVGLAGLVALVEPQFGVLVACRIVQAVGASASYPAALIVLRRLSGDRTPTRSLGLVAVTQTASAAVGPALGGVLVSTVGWQGIFVVNVPLSIIAVAAALRWLPADGPRAPTGPSHRSLDVPGMLLFTAALSGLVAFLLSRGGGFRWALLAVAVVAGTLFVRHGLRTATPFLDVRTTVANRQLIGGLGQQVLAQATFYLAYLGMPIWLENARGLSASQTGLLLMPLAALSLVITPLAARAVEGAGSGPVLCGAALLALAAEAGLLGVDTRTPVPVILVLTSLLGLSMAFTNMGLQADLYRAAASERLGAASGLFQTSRYLGAIAASTLATTILGDHATGAGLHYLAWAGVVMTVVLLVVAGLVAHQAREKPTYGTDSSSRW